METNEPSYLRDVLHFLRNVALIDLCTFAAVALVCWLMGVFTPNAYGNVLELAGGPAIALGAMSFMSGLKVTGSFGYQYGRSVGFGPDDERTRQDVHERRKSYHFTFLMAVVGLVSFGFGMLVQTVFR